VKGHVSKQIDALVYELYGLTEEETRIVEGWKMNWQVGIGIRECATGNSELNVAHLLDCSLAEVYRYLTRDTMESEIEDPPAPGWSSVFIYGMMHPDEEKRDDDYGLWNIKPEGER